MSSDQLAQTFDLALSGLHRGAHCCHIAAYDDGNVAAAELFATYHLDIGGFSGRVNSFKNRGKSLRFNQANCALLHDFSR